jgi:Tfp pilus tip-associated adhesin PilY1
LQKRFEKPIRKGEKKMKKSVFILFIAVVVGMFATQVRGDDTDLFMTQMPPDALIILDMSASMNLDPPGNTVSAPNRRIDIARKILFDLLDDNDNGTIDGSDEKTLNARLGYMRFWNAYSDESSDPLTGNVQVRAPVGSSFKDIWDKINDGNNGAGGTPLAGSLAEAKTYLESYSDPAAACRKKFVILITDGEDTYACSGTGSPSQTDMYKRRMKTVQRAKELNAAGIQVFVVGFGGNLPDQLKKTLNWAAKYGGTDNPLETNSGDPGAYDVTQFGSACNAATSADPALHPLSGYAFLPENADQLATALKSIFGEVLEASYSFGTPSVPSVRLVDQDLIYMGYFEPSPTPFWQGHFKAYRLNEDGSVPVDTNGNPVNPVWEASTGTPESRRIYTVLGDGNSLTEFTIGNLKNDDLDVTRDQDRRNVINHIRGIDAFDVNRNKNVTELRNWAIGDIFHSSAVVVGSPSSSFEDVGFNGTDGFYQRKSARTKVILVGANDGMLHAFNAATGREEWAYIPNGVLKQLKKMSEVHTYYVDSSPKVADVWFYSEASDTTKSADEWKTVLVCGLRKGGKSYFALDITDTTNPSFLWEFPKSSNAETLAKMGESWSEPAIGRVKIEVGEKLVERWVTFVGAGYDPNEKDKDAADVGQGFFVIDIKTGQVLWEFSYLKGEGEWNEMTHSMAAPPRAVDLNFDGYVDRVYAGDLGGQMWVFDVSFDGVGKKSNSQWAGKRLFQPPQENPEKHPVYYQPSVALDPSGTPWVYFGTGDRENPLKKNIQDRFYAVKDDDARGTTDSDKEGYPYSEKDLSDVTSNNTYTRDLLKKGWFIRLEKGEKVLARPMVYNRIVYFTTYTHTDPDPCKVAGTGKLYSVEYLSGGGSGNLSEDAYTTGVLSEVSNRYVVTTGPGLPSAPVITINTTGVASVIVGTVSGQIMSKKAFSPARDNEILYWREVIP